MTDEQILENKRKKLAWILRDDQFISYKVDDFYEISAIFKIYKDQKYQEYKNHAKEMRHFAPHDRNCYKLASKYWWSRRFVRYMQPKLTDEEFEKELNQVFMEEFGSDVIINTCKSFPDQFIIKIVEDKQYIRAIRSSELKK